jgi:hypothetical protein
MRPMATPPNDTPPDANPEAEGAAPAGLCIGPPFALAGECKLIDPKGKGSSAPGCVATVVCDQCSKPFVARLLQPGIKKCPGCGARYTHLLLFCRAEDATIVRDALVHIAQANGLEPFEVANVVAGDEEGDDDEDEGDDDDEEGDDDEEEQE